jgi:predicted alpha/beta hydrolase family esterase
MATVSGECPTHLSTECRLIPIIFVPGTLATRLSDATSHDLVWNPSGGLFGSSPGPAVGKASDLKDLKRDLVPDEWNIDDYPPDLAERARDIYGFYGPLVDYHDKLLFALNEDLADKLAPFGCEPRVYAFGYDWRQDNAKSAAKLQELVKTARQECFGEKVILIAHSQGGLVARYYCGALKGESEVRSFFLIASPSLGSVHPYSRLKAGISYSLDGEIMLGLRVVVLRCSQAESVDLCRHTPSLYQLAPNKVLGAAQEGWMNVDSSHTGYPLERDAAAEAGKGTMAPPASSEPAKGPTFSHGKEPYTALRDMYAGVLDRIESRGPFKSYIAGAEAFHDRLTVGGKAYMHPNTINICTTDLATASSITLQPYGTLTARGNSYEYVSSGCAPVRLWTGRGDGSVMEISGNPPESLLTNRFIKNFVDDGHAGVEHSTLTNHPDTIRIVLEEIEAMFAEEKACES